MHRSKSRSPWRLSSALFILWLLWLAAPTGQAADGNLTWDRSSSLDVVNYRVWWAVGEGLFQSAMFTTLTSAHVSFDASVQNRWYVTALTGVGVESVPSNTVTNGVAPQPPTLQIPAPTGLRASYIVGNRWDLSWQTSASYSTKVERSINGAPFTEFATTPPGTMHITIQAKRQDDVALRVRAFDGQVYSPYSTVLLIPTR